MAENTNECVIEWIPGRDYVGLALYVVSSTSDNLQM